MKVTLTDSQSKAVEKLKAFVNSNEKYYRLTGYAGTGKSFTIAQFMQWLQKQKINFVAGSPTNKAVKNLVKLASENNITIEAHTVAQLLGQQPELNEATGKEEFVTGDSTIGDYDLVIIDEFSMISEANFQDIDYEVSHRDTKVIFVGDPAQLPPVGAKYPIVAKFPMGEATLSEVVRYDGTIAHVAEQIRTYSYFNKKVYPFTTTKDKTITCLKWHDWLENAIGFFKSPDYQDNPDHVRFLVWRNKTARNLNNHVRSHLYGNDQPGYVPGDRLIAKVPVFRLNPNVHNNHDEWNIIINNSEECEVIGRATIGIDKTHQWEYWEVPVITANRTTITLRILRDESESQRQLYLQQLKKDKKWKKYYYWLKLYDNVPYSYAITTHKAQGSSIDYIFLDTTDMSHCPDLQKILYTALTRAKKQAFIPIL